MGETPVPHYQNATFVIRESPSSFLPLLWPLGKATQVAPAGAICENELILECLRGQNRFGKHRVENEKEG